MKAIIIILFRQLRNFLFIITSLSLFTISVNIMAAGSTGLFIGKVNPKPVTPSGASIRTRTVQVNMDQFIEQTTRQQMIASASPAPSSTPSKKNITMNLFDDVVAKAHRTSGYKNKSGSTTWIGKVENKPNSSAIFIIRSNTVYGVIEIPDVGKFSIHPTHNGDHIIEQIKDDAELSAEEDDVYIPSKAPRKTNQKRQSKREIPQAYSVEISNDDGSIIDVFVAYDKDAPGGSVEAVDAQSYAELFVAYTNQAYANSNINQRLWLVGTVDGFNHTDTDTNSLNADLDAAQNGSISGLHAKRNEYHADLVLFFAPYDGNSCGGLAFLQIYNNDLSWEDSAYAAMEACSFGATIFAHELGHNMGSRHDWYVDNGTTPTTTAHGYIDTTNNFRTIMSYGSRCSALGVSCPKIPYFSNPSINYAGATTGVAAGTNSSCATGDASPATDCDADNASNFNAKALITSQFRDSRLSWTGAINSDWNTAGNWTINEGAPGSTAPVHRVPRSFDNVFIPSGLATYPMITGIANARELTIQSGATLNMSGGTITVGWSWEDSGGFNATAGTVIFSGPIGIEINSSSAFKNVQIGSGSDTSVVKLDNNINIDGSLVISTGAKLFAGSHTINLAGDWTELDATGFTPETSTVIFDGVSQSVSKVTDISMLNEDFSAYNSSCCTSAMPDGWAGSSSSYYQGDLLVDGDGAANRWRDQTDGYLYTPALDLQAGFVYQLQYDVAVQKTGGSLSPQTISVHLGSAQNAAAMTTVISAEALETSTSYQTRTVSNISVAVSGTYYMGFRAQQSGDDYVSFDDISLTGMKNISFYNLQVASGITTFTSDLSIQHDFQTDNGATVNFVTHDVAVEGMVVNHGSIKQTKTVANGALTNFGLITNAAGSLSKYYGIEVTPDTGSMGNTTVEIKGNQTCAASGPPATGVLRCYIITPASDQTATVKFYYRSVESNSNTTPNVYRQTGASWTEQTTSARGGSGEAVWATSSNLANYGLFALTENTVANSAPVAVADAYNTDENTQLTVAVSGVLGNDSDANGDPLTAILVTNVSNGSLVLNSNGSFTYTPNANFNGTDSFTYKANDNTDDSNIVTVSLTINAANVAPIAVVDSYITNEDTLLTVAASGVLGNDSDANGDALTAVLVANVSNGILNFNTNGSFTYSPNSDFSGTDSFSYKANDGAADSNVVTVSLTINALNDAPIAVADSYTTDKDTVLNVATPGVLSNDTDVDSAALTATLVSSVSNGGLTLNTDGSFNYLPNAGFSGADSFTYLVNDGSVNSVPVTVGIIVNSSTNTNLTTTTIVPIIMLLLLDDETP